MFKNQHYSITRFRLKHITKQQKKEVFLIGTPLFLAMQYELFKHCCRLFINRFGLRTLHNKTHKYNNSCKCWNNPIRHWY